MKSLYVVLSKTGTITSRAISKFTGDWFTHVSISLDNNLQTMYSFGRLWSYCPWPGGFVKESVEYGLMRRFKKADILVMQVDVSDDKHAQIVEFIATMYAERKKYKYNYWGALLSRWNVRFRSKNPRRLYCSEFVMDFLERFGIIQQEELGEVVRPMEVLKLEQSGKGKVIYRGALCQFPQLKI